MRALTGARVLLDGGFAEGVAVLVDGARIVDVVGSNDAHVRAAERIELGGGTLAPGFIDVQVNGGGGVLFNDRPDVDGVRTIAAAHRRFGTTGLLPTLISDDDATMDAALRAVTQAIEANVPGVLGIHFEGPYLAPQRKGIHDAAHFRVPGAADFARLTQARGSVFVTLAPEQVAPDAIRELVARGTIVAAGHTAATYEQTRAALDAGLSGFTHLFNAMSPLTSREPGVVGAALEDRASWCGIIADGFHAHAASLRIALAAKPRGKLVLVTDAMPPVGAASDTFTLNGETIVCRDGRCTNADGVLAGSALDMASAVRYAVTQLGVGLDEALRMASTYPAAWIQQHERGRIAPGMVADLVLLDPQNAVRATWIGGAVQWH
jgi:N-acetylglucosamine-6-phosphate deacetylase